LPPAQRLFNLLVLALYHAFFGAKEKKSVLFVKSNDALSQLFKDTGRIHTRKDEG
jgi:hypothetical protein